MSLPVVQDDSLCTPIITWNSLTPPPQQYFPTHRLRFETPLKHLKSQVIGQEICINVYTNGMRGSRNFRQGGPGQSDKKALATFFFLVLSLFYRSQMVKFKENYHFSRFQRGSNIFQGGGGGVQLFPGGSNCLFPIETHITCAFPGGSGPPAPPPSLDPHLHASFE